MPRFRVKIQISHPTEAITCPVYINLDAPTDRHRLSPSLCTWVTEREHTPHRLKEKLRQNHNWYLAASLRYNNDRLTHLGRWETTNAREDADAQSSSVPTLLAGWQGQKPLPGTDQRQPH